jgi:hypothetical protein
MKVVKFKFKFKSAKSHNAKLGAVGMMMMMIMMIMMGSCRTTSHHTPTIRLALRRVVNLQVLG